jgi:hypothetical protein
MPTIACPCGTVIDLAKVPSPYGSKVISEVDFDDIRDRLAAAGASREALETAIYKDVLGFRNEHIKQAYVCPTCWRLYLFASASDREPRAVWTLERGDGSIMLSSQERPAQ